MAAVSLSEEQSTSHRLFGTAVTGNFPLTPRLPLSRAPAELILTVSDHPLLSPEDLAFPPLYVSPLRDGQGRSLGCLYRAAEGEAFRFPEAGDFRISSDRIETYVPAQSAALAELRLLGPVLSYWLERRGIPTLHASAVATDRGAVAFLSRKEGGKTGLAAAFLQAGLPLVTDDVLPVEEAGGTFLARPGYAQMRMWPDEAAHFVEGWEGLPTVHPDISKRRVPVGDGGFGTFHDASLPLACLYVPERVTEGTVEIQDVSPRDAVIELLRHSFSPRLVEAVGLGPRRLDFFARLAMQVPVRRLRYPSGFDRLPEAVERVLSGSR